MDRQLPFELMVAICEQFSGCQCARPDQVFALGCTGHHAPSAFGCHELSALRQTSRAWRSAALAQGLSELVVSNRWMVQRTAGDRLIEINRRFSSSVRRIVFRASDFYHNGPRRSATGRLLDELVAILALGWPCLSSIAIEWFSGDSQEHSEIARTVARYAPRLRDLYVSDKGLSWAQLAPKVLDSRIHNAFTQLPIRRLAIKPYGYDKRWPELAPQESGAAQILHSVPGRLRTVAVGGCDFTSEFVCALQSQTRLRSLSIEHAWVVPGLSARAVLPSVTRLHLENIVLDSACDVLPLSARMFPNLRTLTVRHVWQQDTSHTARGAALLQSANWLDLFLDSHWPALDALSLPAISDDEAARLAFACPNLTRLTTNSLEYSGPQLTARGLVTIVRSLGHLRYLAIEQRASQGSHISDTGLRNILDGTWPLAIPRIRRSSTASTAVGSPVLTACDSPLLSDTDVEDDGAIHVISRTLNTLVIPRVSFSSMTVETLARALPNLVALSVALRTDTFFSPSYVKDQRAAGLAWTHACLKRIVLAADEDVIADPKWLSAWFGARFPNLAECATGYSRAYAKNVRVLKEALPNVVFKRLGSRALQTTCD